VFSRNVFRFGFLGIACLLGTAAVRAQSPSAAVAGSNIRVINMLQAISSTAEGKQASSELQSQFAPRQQELESVNKQIEDLQKRLGSQPPLSDEESTRIRAEGTQLEQRLERKKQEYQEDLNNAQSEAVNGIGRKMVDVLNRYALEHSLVEIVDSSNQNSPILYAAKNLDITEEIVRLYDQAHPVKSASAAPVSKPSPAAKPAAPSAGKSQ
jgi:outer membrane protein